MNPQIQEPEDKLNFDEEFELEPTPKPGWNLPKIPFSLLAVGLVAVLIAVITLGIFSSARSSKKSAEAEAKKTEVKKAKTTTPTTSSRGPAVTTKAVLNPMGECWTPCSLSVAWDQTLRTGGRPVRIKFNGKRKWYLFPGSGPVPLSEFAPGEAQFTSPENDSTPVQVRILQ